MSNPFQRGDTSPVNLPPPFGSLLAFLADLHEQIELELAKARHPAAIAVLTRLRSAIESAGFVVLQMRH